LVSNIADEIICRFICGPAWYGKRMDIGHHRAALFARNLLDRTVGPELGRGRRQWRELLSERLRQTLQQLKLLRERQGACRLENVLHLCGHDVLSLVSHGSC
jgi:hypothetical protein